MRKQYFTALAQVSRSEDGGLQALADLQRQVFASDSLRGIAKLHRFQLAMLNILNARAPDASRPVVWLHYETAGCYTSREEHALRVPSLLLAADLATSMRRSARSSEDRRFATDVMVCSAYTLLDDGNKNQAVGLFGRIALLDPSNAPALLGAAAIHERYGRYEQAADLLKNLLEHNPESMEARLRLAVNLARLHHSDEAEQLLRALVVETSQPWIRTVGYQELARRMMTSGRPAEAQEVLREAVAAVPDNHSLKIQLAVVLDLAHQEREAARVIEEIQPEAADDGVSPRWQYAVWPEYDRPGHERQLRAQAEAAAPALADALQAMAQAAAS